MDEYSDQPNSVSSLSKTKNNNFEDEIRLCDGSHLITLTYVICIEILSQNKLSMSSLKNLNLCECFNHLQRANQMLDLLWNSEPFNKTEKFFTVASITHNNFGCYYQKRNLTKNALACFQKSINYNKHIRGDEMNLSSTHLNICALFSQLGSHKLAQKHGKMALRLLPAAYK